jgi:hypothetical protein
MAENMAASRLKVSEAKLIILSRKKNVRKKVKQRTFPQKLKIYHENHILECVP